jgi:hypothetical protein
MAVEVLYDERHENRDIEVYGIGYDLLSETLVS